MHWVQTRIVLCVPLPWSHGPAAGWAELPAGDAGDLGADSAEVFGLTPMGDRVPDTDFFPQTSHSRDIRLPLNELGTDHWRNTQYNESIGQNKG